jgi:biotin synthase
MMARAEILAWLTQGDLSRLEDLWSRADAVRREHVGNEVHLRGLVELSNYCVRMCGYCGLRAGNRAIERYRMTADEIFRCAALAVELGYGTVVLQSGEDPLIEGTWLADLVRRIKAHTPLAVTLSLGERSDEDLALWRSAGADRYLLRFETSNRKLYDAIHPPLGGARSDRIAMLRRLREMGYEIGSGVMIGIPGQTHADLARDIELFGELDLDMIGVGPFIAHPDTPLASAVAAAAGQVAADELTTYKVVALARLACPRANIPATTALATLNLTQGRELGLSRGANIVMPNLTPVQYRAKYEIYPAKACVKETARDCHQCLSQRILNLGRTIGVGRGDSPRMAHARNRGLSK